MPRPYGLMFEKGEGVNRGIGFLYNQDALDFAEFEENYKKWLGPSPYSGAEYEKQWLEEWNLASSGQSNTGRLLLDWANKNKTMLLVGGIVGLFLFSRR